MHNKKLKIVVTGDLCINCLQWITDPQSNKGLNWQTRFNMHTTLQPGGALLLSKLVALATENIILSPEIENIESISSNELLRSYVELKPFPMYSHEDENGKVYRISRFLGFSGPTSGVPRLLSITDDDIDADMVVLDDEDNGFNSKKEFWPLAIKSTDKSPVVLYKMDNPIGSSLLWKHLHKFHNEKTIVIINIDDLRSKGVRISKSLSWESTAQDFVWQINNNPNLDFLSNCRHIVVVFGLEGCIYYKNNGEVQSRLYFLPYEFEGGFVKDTLGKMYGLTSCFVAGLAGAIVNKKHIDEDISKSIDSGIRQGIVSAKKYFIHGFSNDVGEFPFPSPKIFVENEKDSINNEHVQDVLIPKAFNKNCDSSWYILKDKSSTNIAEIAYDIVKNGEKNALKFIPIAKFGKLKTVDRTEIESYTSIKNLLIEYISTKNSARPLSIAVFGTPGSGKSFGITEVVSNIASNLIERLNFNLSQFQSPLDLIHAFHRVRDISLGGKIALVFFDEFDSTFEGKLGWLKYFLAPMQDGLFRQGDSTHPIGKAIFVFAGGTSSTFEAFCGEEFNSSAEKEQFHLEFKAAKGPDFISRLRGYVNILGPNQTHEKRDQLFIIRRAMLMRSLLERKVSHLINDKGEAQIDKGVLRALLKVPKYKHGSRSMEAIIEMSMLNSAKKWEQSHLPSKEQLKLHVDEEQFTRLLMHEAFFSEKIEIISRGIYEKCKMLNESNSEINLDSIKSWEEVSENIKNLYRNQVRHIPSSLLKINYDITFVKEKPETFNFTEEELNTLAEYQYIHLELQSIEERADWKYGEVKDNNIKSISSILSWENLSSMDKNILLEMVSSWPEVLANSNFKIEPLEFTWNCECDE
ncbi:Ryanodine receptor Ryr [Wukongibacter sp. M2B1]|uniref:Ryanodine receptor Ryr n=1 Tax=Wukongibacter sp. M2B1 TaxID=3088895 RepID=UPI003D7BACF3